jgi:hypothetical protein
VTMATEPKTMAQTQDELAREIVRALGYEFFVEDLHLAPSEPGMVAVVASARVRHGGLREQLGGRRAGDKPPYISEEQFAAVKTLLALYTDELAHSNG